MSGKAPTIVIKSVVHPDVDAYFAAKYYEECVRIGINPVDPKMAQLGYSLFLSGFICIADLKAEAEANKLIDLVKKPNGQ